MNLRRLLFPISLLYKVVTGLRNLLFDKGILPSTQFDVPTLVVGNLSTGGTGKTPHTEYFLRLFEEKSCGVISRGYGRKSRGFLWVETQSMAEQVGDEPLQMKKRFPEIPFAVCEDRVLAVPEFLAQEPDVELLVFDDAFQHRYLKGKAYVLLTVYGDLFCDDFVLPAGNLREARRGAKRADVIMITKCPPDLDEKEQEQIRRKLNRYSAAPVYFSFLERREPCYLDGTPCDPAEREEWTLRPVFLFSAIAHGGNWARTYLKDFSGKSGELLYPDHHAFTSRDIALLRKKWEAAGKPLVLTTEKDAMRVLPFQKELADMEVVYFPIRVKLLSDEGVLKENIDSLLF